MFDENFSFLFPISTPFTVPQNDSPAPTDDISPFSSRCSSPILRPTTHSLPLRTRDDRFNSRPPTMIPAPRHPSITALSSDFTSQATLSPSNSATSSPYSSVSTPSTPLSDLDLDDPLIGPEDALFPRSNSCSFEASMWDLNLASPNPTSYPLDHPLPAFALKRRQRQALGRLQCLTKRAPDLSMLVEECHPSSMPVPVRDGAGRSKSIGSGGRIEKDRSRSITSGIVKRLPKMRKKAGR